MCCRLRQSLEYLLASAENPNHVVLFVRCVPLATTNLLIEVSLLSLPKSSAEGVENAWGMDFRLIS